MKNELKKELSWPIVGHEKLVQFLEQTVLRGTVAHAYGFYGPDGAGKTWLAKLFVQALLCEKQDGKPCGACRSCAAITKGSHADVFEIRRKEDEKNIGIDDIRALQSRIAMSPSRGNYHVAIVSDAHLLSVEAQNSMLKTLEEPPKTAMIILVTDQWKDLLPTLRSRLLGLRLPLLRASVLIGELKSRHPQLTDPKIRFISHAVSGRFGEASVLAGDSALLARTEEEYRAVFDFTVHPIGKKLSQLADLFGKKSSFVEQQGIAREFCQKLLLVFSEGLRGGLQMKKNAYQMERLLNVLGLLKQNVHPRLLLEQFCWDVSVQPPHQT
ncbi:MAG TPA: AAA family ATPase [Patescibacteria group bacterium]|nr:AAA family ATPase [Patescibacteria group bacterium]